MATDLQKQIDKVRSERHLAEKIYKLNFCADCVAKFRTPEPLCGACREKAAFVTMVLNSVPMQYCSDCQGVHP